ncbi:undecaprenyl-phosphate glucose phosphotransferase [Marinobacter lipolyticus]|uniref:undecaprenyl-phosphate glucose phosphotransferase n=1 Tax=Marinobacter lipolyticus TaxID=209639 RepID=UPI003A8F5A70
MAPESEPKRVIFWLQWLVASAVQLGLLAILALDQSGSLAPHYRILAVMSLIASIPLCAIFRIYSPDQGYLVGLARLLAGWAVLASILVFLAFVTKTGELYSREAVLKWMVGGYLLQALAFLPLHKLARTLERKSKGDRRSVIIGTDELAQALAYKLRYQRKEPMLGMVELDDQVASEAEHDPSQRYYPVLGAVSQLRSILADNEVARVYIALPAGETDQIEGLYVDLLDAHVDVIWVPDIANLKLLNHSLRDLDGMPAVYLNESPLTAYPSGALLKSTMDRLLALFGILMLAPLLIGIALAVKASSPGPILFKQKRHGWNGNVINVMKFRSMRMHDDKQVKQAQKDDPRVTWVGKYIRRTSLDELPQLFNVLIGDMSLVGPRPHAVAHNDYYSDKIIAYMARHRIKPGITGLAQVSGCRGETETIDKMQKRVELDLDYINHWSLWLDLRILIKTPLTLLSKNIY